MTTHRRSLPARPGVTMLLLGAPAAALLALGAAGGHPGAGAPPDHVHVVAPRAASPMPAPAEPAPRSALRFAEERRQP